MQTKLTLQIDDDLIKYAEEYAQSHGKSVSDLVADFLFILKAGGGKTRADLPKVVKELRGIAKGKVSEEDYYRYLEEKYR